MIVNRYAAYGLTVGCESLDVAVERLRRTLEAASEAGVAYDNRALVTAKDVYANETSFWSKHVLALSSVQCAGWTREVTQAADALATEIKIRAPTVVVPEYRPDYDQGGDLIDQTPDPAKIAGKWLGWTSPLVIVGLLAAGGYVLAQLATLKRAAS